MLNGVEKYRVGEIALKLRNAPAAAREPAILISGVELDRLRAQIVNLESITALAAAELDALCEGRGQGWTRMDTDRHGLKNT